MRTVEGGSFGVVPIHRAEKRMQAKALAAANQAHENPAGWQEQAVTLLLILGLTAGALGVAALLWLALSSWAGVK